MQYVYNKPTTSLHDDDDDDNPRLPPGGMISIKKKAFQHYEQTMSAQQIHFYISDELGAPDQYTDMIHRLAIAGPNDIVFIHLNTPGGRLDTGVQIINAMQNSPAKIVTVLESTAFSMGTMLFLAGDEMVVNDHCMMMFHNFKGGVVGKGNELTSQLEATVKWFAALAKKIYIPFLTEDEFDRIVKGEDIWMQSGEIRKRLDRVVNAAKPVVKTPTKKPRGRKPKSSEE